MKQSVRTTKVLSYLVGATRICVSDLSAYQVHVGLGHCKTVEAIGTIRQVAMLAVPSSSSSQALSLAWPPRKICQGATICLQFYSGSSNILPRDNTGRHAHQSTTTQRHALPDTFSNRAGTLLGGVDGLAAAVRKTPWRLSRDHREALMGLGFVGRSFWMKSTGYPMLPQTFQAGVEWQ